jgi:helicase
VKIAELDIPINVKNILQTHGFSDLFPPQIDAIRTGVLDGTNLVLASPTASGKTLIAELCAMKHVIEQKGKVLYLTPLKALTWEKFEEFKKYTSIEKPNKRKLRVGVSTGDMDNASPWLKAFDIVISTNEKCDSLLRHRSPWMNGISLVIADEIHLISSDRGPTLEILLARLLQMNPNLQILALSATISNAEEIAEWLNAKSVTTEWRPVKLYEGVALGNHIMFKNGARRKIKSFHKQAAINLALNAVDKGGQVLIFVESRRRAQSVAKTASNALKKFITPMEETKLHQVATQISSYGEKTRLSDDLAQSILMGAVFHHAGLNREHRRIVEKAFKEGIIKILSATPTLAAGVNLPARTVIIGSYKRFLPGYGMYPIKVLEYKQMSGRAGRPQYDEYGEALLIALSADEQDFLMEDYILAQPERIDSRLAKESSLRGHILAAVSSDYAHTEGGLLDFFGSTFYGFNYPTSEIKLIQANILRYLHREGMLEYKGDKIFATEFGRRISELYIDPLTAVIIRDGLKRGALDQTDFTWLNLICHTPDMRPLIRPRRNEIELIEIYIDEHLEEFAIPIDTGFDYIDFESFLSEVKTSMILKEWIEETSENDLYERYNIQPGDRYSAVTNAEWLLYSTHELAKILGIQGPRRHLRKLIMRVKYGVGEKLLPLVQLNGIGRVRAQVLYRSGFKSKSDLKRAEISRLIELPLIGSRLAKIIKEQVGGLIDKKEWEKLKIIENEQQSLFTYIEEEHKNNKNAN